MRMHSIISVAFKGEFMYAGDCRYSLENTDIFGRGGGRGIEKMKKFLFSLFLVEWGQMVISLQHNHFLSIQAYISPSTD